MKSVPILYPLKTPEKLWFSGVLRGYKIGTDVVQVSLLLTLNI